ncbi:MAG: hypothetical protein OXG81_16225 [Acidobacteria bacterium]|nr:hypothetical protein [Acidobacteriota bacterium]
MCRVGRGGYTPESPNVVLLDRHVPVPRKLTPALQRLATWTTTKYCL